MDKDERILVLENVIAQMLKPLKNVPFDLLIKGLSGKRVLKFDASLAVDMAFLKILEDVVLAVHAAVSATPIARPRPNEVGNDIEPFVQQALKLAGCVSETPSGASGKKKSTGYPDLLVFDPNKRPIYLECKTYSESSIDTSFRAFYLSPSTDFKISHDAQHLLVAFEMIVIGRNGLNNLYVPKNAKIISLEDLLCDVKYEFNASNRGLYQNSRVLREISFILSD